MPRIWRADDEYEIIRDLVDGQRRQGVAVSASQMPQPAKDRLVIASNGQPGTWQLSAIPAVSAPGSSLNLSLNGVELDEATDYSVDYTTGLVTFSSGQQALFKATPTPADVLTADYLTSGDLIAATLPADNGSISDNFNRANSASTLGTTSDGKATWVAAAGTWGIDTNQAYQTVFSGAHKLAYVETGASDGTLLVSVPTPGGQNGAGLLLRYVDINNWYAVMVKAGINLSRMIYLVGGVSTVSANFTFTVGNVLKATMLGSTISVYDGTTSTLLATDTNGYGSTATKHGLYITQNDLAPRLDDWSFT